MSHNLFNWCCHFAYSDAAMWLKCIGHLKNEIFMQKFAMSATSEYFIYIYFFKGGIICSKGGVGGGGGEIASVYLPECDMVGECIASYSELLNVY